MTTMVTVAAVAAFVTIFCLLSAHSLWNKLSYQSLVITAKTTARNQLNTDITAASNLTSSYIKFNDASSNLLGGAVTGIDNDNAKIVLDALPSTYDYPALTSSLQSLLSNQGVTIDGISGTDQSTLSSSSSSSSGASSSGSTPIAMPFSFTVDGPYQDIQNVISTFEKSIRPFQFQTLTLAGDQTDVTLTATAETYFQPATQFTITTQKVQ